jgi:hypothetical protein
MGYSVSDLKDPYKNMDASIQTMAQISKKYNGDPAKVAAAYNWGPGNLDKHLANNNNTVNVDSLPKETKGYLANVLTKLAPGSTAHAATLPAAKIAPVVPDVTNQSSLAANETVAPDTRSWWDRAVSQTDAFLHPIKKSAAEFDPNTFYDPKKQALVGVHPEMLALGAPGRLLSLASKLYTPAEESGLPSISTPATTPTVTAANESNAGIPSVLTPAQKQQMNMVSRGRTYEISPEAVAMNQAARARLIRQGARPAASESVPIESSLAANESVVAPSTWASRLNEKIGADVATGRNAKNVLPEEATGIQTVTPEAAAVRQAAQAAAARRAASREADSAESAEATIAESAPNILRETNEAASVVSPAIVNAAKAASAANAAAKANQSSVPGASSAIAPDVTGDGIDQRPEAGGPFKYSTEATSNLPVKDPSEFGIDQRPEAGGPFNYKDSTEQQGPPISAMNRDKDSSSSISAQPAKDASMLSSDDWLALAAGLLSNKSQYASEAFGAGLGSLVQGRAARKAAESQQALQAAQAKEAVGKGGYYDQLSSTVGPETAAKIAYQGSETTRLDLLNKAFPQKNAAEIRQIDANIQREVQSANYIGQQARYYGPEATSKINLQDAAAALDISRKNMFEGKNDVQSIREMIDALKPIAHSMPDPLIPESARQIMEAKNHLQYYSEQLAKKTGIGVPDNAIPGFTVRAPK